MKTSLTNAALWKAEIVLLVPAVVNPATLVCRRRGHARRR